MSFEAVPEAVAVKSLLLSICFLTFSSAVAEADLRYRMRVDVRFTSAQLKDALPAVETVMLITGDAVRVEQVGGAARSVLLMRPDGQFALDLEARTYWRIPESVLTVPASTPPAFRRTGEFATILGLRAERVEATMSLPMPIMPPPGLPTVVSMTGELWIADAYRAYARNIGRATGSSSAVPSGIEGIVLRQVVRNAQLGIEIEHQVTELIEAPVAREMFEVPDGFRRVTGPAGPR
jgi:hypothetical protein